METIFASVVGGVVGAAGGAACACADASPRMF